MTQCQIDHFKEAYKCDYDQLTTDLLKRQAVYTIDSETEIVIKKTHKRETFIQLVVKGKKVKIGKDIWSKLCNLKESILFLHSFIEDH